MHDKIKKKRIIDIKHHVRILKQKNNKTNILFSINIHEHILFLYILHTIFINNNLQINF